MYPHNYLSDEENIDDFDSDDWACRLGIRLVDDQWDRIAEEAERDGAYAKDWEFISYQVRSQQDFICEDCGVDCSKETPNKSPHHGVVKASGLLSVAAFVVLLYGGGQL